MSILYPLLKKHNNVNLHSKLTLYRSYIRPVLTYACPVFDNAAKTHIKRLQVIQNKCLRMALNSPYRTRISSLHYQSDIPYIHDYIGKLSESFFKNSAKSNNKLISRLGDYDARLGPHIKRKHKLPKRSS